MSPAQAPLRGFVVAGTHSGVGKTTVSLGLLRALVKRGLAVQPFKVGPDFIDPLHHTRAAKRRSRNLDTWMLDESENRQIFARAVADADVALVEGVMGLFDGAEGASDRGSAADIARLLGLPIVLVIDASAMARSAAALIHGFTTFADDLRFAGVILNRVGGEGHADIVRAALAGGVPVLGWLSSAEGEMGIPERHLGLQLPDEQAEDYVDRLGDFIEAHIDIDSLFANGTVDRPSPRPSARRPEGRVRVGVIRDPAFCFYYEDNLDQLREAGADLIFFSALKDDLPDGLDGLYIGGGYPELHAAALETNRALRKHIRAASGAGLPILAECGGLMYLGERLNVADQTYEMCGAIPCQTSMPTGLKLGYVEARTLGGPLGKGLVARGHVFHHSDVDRQAQHPAFDVLGVGPDGFCSGQTVASYLHLHFSSCPKLARNFIAACSTSTIR
jgi:cobyrinic acid a,c-diamide synthase